LRRATGHVSRITADGDMTDKCACLFPGQGSQYVGMGRDLYATSPTARAVFDQADHILGIGLSQLCFDGPSDGLNDTWNTQPAILTTSVAMLRALEERGMDHPVYVAGHSMGEFSALVAADALSFEDGLKLVRERGRLMRQANDRSPGGMAAILGLERELVETICTAAGEQSGEYVGVANDNCPGQIVISGTTSALERAMELAKERGAKRATRLAVSIAAHSPLMAEAAAEFIRVLDTTPFHEPSIPLVANATARPLTDPAEIRDALGRQLTSPVRWTESVRWIIAQGVTRFVEVGPKEVLTGLLRRIDGTVERLTTAHALGQGT
jgi:[acyl-carrier-protein] S-malonyltransferase